MKRRVLAALLATAMVATMVAGCGGGSDAEQEKTDEQTEQTEGTEEGGDDAQASDTGYSERTVVVATSGNGEPYSLIADDGTWTGIDAEMWDEIGKRTGWTIEVKQAAFDAVWGELDTGRADVCANCWAVRPEREEKYQATIPYYGDAQCVIVPESNTTIHTFEDLKGLTVGCTNGQAAQNIIQEMGEEIGFTVTLYEDSNVGLGDLNLGRVDAYAYTTTGVYNYEHYNENVKFRFLDEDLTANNVAYFLQKNDEGKALCEELNKVIQEMLDDGTIAKITEKWMYADMTQLIQE